MGNDGDSPRKSTIIAPGQTPEHGYCPFASSASVIPAGMPDTMGNVRLQIVNAQAPCLADKCQLWAPADNCCSLSALAIPNSIQTLCGLLRQLLGRKEDTDDKSGPVGQAPKPGN